MLSISKISICDVITCSYNREKKCNTPAVTIGNGHCPMCDTFVRMDKKAGDPDVIGGVGACRSDKCKYNKMLECSAGFIHVGSHNSHADCATFRIL